MLQTYCSTATSAGASTTPFVCVADVVDGSAATCATSASGCGSTSTNDPDPWTGGCDAGGGSDGIVGVRLGGVGVGSMGEDGSDGTVEGRRDEAFHIAVLLSAP